MSMADPVTTQLAKLNAAEEKRRRKAVKRGGKIPTNVIPESMAMATGLWNDYRQDVTAWEVIVVEGNLRAGLTLKVIRDGETVVNTKHYSLVMWNNVELAKVKCRERCYLYFDPPFKLRRDDKVVTQ